MNWVDVAVIAVIAFSALLAFIRGLVREVLGIGAWIAAGFFATWALPLVRDRFHALISEPDVAEVVGYGVVFLAALLILTMVSSIIGGAIRTSVLSGLDRTLGVVFGLVRGVAAVVLAYIIGGMVVPSLDRWPEPVRDARTLPYVYEGAALVARLLPPDYRPALVVPPGERELKAAELFRANPRGRAVARP